MAEYLHFIFLNRHVELNSHHDYKNYRETILGRPLVFIINVRTKYNSSKGMYHKAIVKCSD